MTFRSPAFRRKIAITFRSPAFRRKIASSQLAARKIPPEGGTTKRGLRNVDYELNNIVDFPIVPAYPVRARNVCIATAHNAII